MNELLGSFHCHCFDRHDFKVFVTSATHIEGNGADYVIFNRKRLTVSPFYMLKANQQFFERQYQIIKFHEQGKRELQM